MSNDNDKTNGIDKILIEFFGTLIIGVIMVLILGLALTGLVWVFQLLWEVAGL